MDEVKAFAVNLRRLRKERGWTLRELSAASGAIAIGSISKIERGDARPGLFVACALARALGTTVDAMTGMGEDGRE